MLPLATRSTTRWLLKANYLSNYSQQFKIYLTTWRHDRRLMNCPQYVFAILGSMIILRKPEHWFTRSGWLWKHQNFSGNICGKINKLFCGNVFEFDVENWKEKTMVYLMVWDTRMRRYAWWCHGLNCQVIFCWSCFKIKMKTIFFQTNGARGAGRITRSTEQNVDFLMGSSTTDMWVPPPAQRAWSWGQAQGFLMLSGQQTPGWEFRKSFVRENVSVWVRFLATNLTFCCPKKTLGNNLSKLVDKVLNFQREIANLTNQSRFRTDLISFFGK